MTNEHLSVTSAAVKSPSRASLNRWRTFPRRWLSSPDSSFSPNTKYLRSNFVPLLLHRLEVQTYNMYLRSNLVPLLLHRLQVQTYTKDHLCGSPLFFDRVCSKMHFMCRPFVCIWHFVMFVMCVHCWNLCAYTCTLKWKAWGTIIKKNCKRSCLISQFIPSQHVSRLFRGDSLNSFLGYQKTSASGNSSPKTHRRLPLHPPSDQLRGSRYEDTLGTLGTNTGIQK